MTKGGGAPEGWIEVDLHAHTDSSYDSMTAVGGLIKTSRKVGLGAVGITDHESFRGCERLERGGLSEGFPVVKGEEICTEVGDVVGLFLQDGIKSRSVMSVIDEVHSQGGITMLPHPYRSHHWEVINEAVLHGIDVVEGYNGRTAEKLNLDAVNLAKRLGKPIVANSDSHFWPEVGRCRTILRCDADLEAIRKAVLAGNRDFRTSKPLRTMKYLSTLLGVSKEKPFLGRTMAVVTLPFVKAKKVVRGLE